MSSKLPDITKTYGQHVQAKPSEQLMQLMTVAWGGLYNQKPACQIEMQPDNAGLRGGWAVRSYVSDAKFTEQLAQLKAMAGGRTSRTSAN